LPISWSYRAPHGEVESRKRPASPGLADVAAADLPRADIVSGIYLQIAKPPDSLLTALSFRPSQAIAPPLGDASESRLGPFLGRFEGLPAAAGRSYTATRDIVSCASLLRSRSTILTRRCSGKRRTRCPEERVAGEGKELRLCSGSGGYLRYSPRSESEASRERASRGLRIMEAALRCSPNSTIKDANVCSRSSRRRL
jgi:hypothetical protein